MANPQTDKAHQAIGAYQCAFSSLEHELGETVKAILKLQEPKAADLLVVAMHDFRRKTQFIKDAIKVAKKPVGSEVSQQWKVDAVKTIDSVLNVNDDRNAIRRQAPSG